MSCKILDAGISIKNYNTGQCSGIAYSVPAHAEISIEFDLKMDCISPPYIEILDNLVYSLLDASNKEKYKELKKNPISGGCSFVPFFGTSKASCEDTRYILNNWGLSLKNQKIILETMLITPTSWNSFPFKGTIDNKSNDYVVKGKIYYIFMSCQVSIDERTVEQTYTAPIVHFQNDSGKILPVIGKLY
jgi:hypothetical protein